MKTMMILSLFALGAITASAQTYTLDYTSVPLTTSSNYTLGSSASGSGNVKGFGCRVTAAVTGTPSATISVQLDGIHWSTYTIYASANSWNSEWSIFQSLGSTSSSGANVGDTFYVPLDVPYTSGLTITMLVSSTASAGSLECNSLYS